MVNEDKKQKKNSDISKIESIVFMGCLFLIGLLLGALQLQEVQQFRWVLDHHQDVRYVWFQKMLKSSPMIEEEILPEVSFKKIKELPVAKVFAVEGTGMVEFGPVLQAAQQGGDDLRITQPNDVMECLIKLPLIRKEGQTKALSPWMIRFQGTSLKWDRQNEWNDLFIKGDLLKGLGGCWYNSSSIITFKKEWSPAQNYQWGRFVKGSAWSQWHQEAMTWAFSLLYLKKINPEQGGRYLEVFLDYIQEAQTENEASVGSQKESKGWWLDSAALKEGLKGGDVIPAQWALSPGFQKDLTGPPKQAWSLLELDTLKKVLIAVQKENGVISQHGSKDKNLQIYQQAMDIASEIVPVMSEPFQKNGVDSRLIREQKKLQESLWDTATRLKFLLMESESFIWGAQEDRHNIPQRIQKGLKKEAAEKIIQYQENLSKTELVQLLGFYWWMNRRQDLLLEKSVLHHVSLWDEWLWDEKKSNQSSNSVLTKSESGGHTRLSWQGYRDHILHEKEEVPGMRREEELVSKMLQEVNLLTWKDLEDRMARGVNVSR